MKSLNNACFLLYGKLKIEINSKMKARLQEIGRKSSCKWERDQEMEAGEKGEEKRNEKKN